MTKNSSQSRSSPAPTVDTNVKSLRFGFPFLKKGNGQNTSASQFTDEHEIYRGLANNESSGGYLVGRHGMWHGGIHVTAAGFGQHIDLAAGVRCIADGEVVAYRINRSNLTSERPGGGGADSTTAEYSTGFALVRHVMEFPKGKTLTFFSLYMHLMAYDDYRKSGHASWAKPAHWPQVWEITQYARDVPAKGRLGQATASSQRGLRVRTQANGRILGILPQGARVTLEPAKSGWAKLKTIDLNGTSVIPHHADGHATVDTISKGWISIGHEHGGPLVCEVPSADAFDTVQVPGTPTPIKMGDLVGHLGRYDKLEPGSGANSQVHIETFTADDIDAYIKTSSAWIREHGAHKDDWTPLGLPYEPMILRVAPGTVLYERSGNGMPQGTETQRGKTGVVQSQAMAVLSSVNDSVYTEPEMDSSAKRRVTWWHVESADLRGQPIKGWVRDFNHTPGRVTREFPQKWVDFKCITHDHDPSHTIFADTATWVEFANSPDTPGVASRAKLSPLMQQVYDALFTEGNNEQAAIQLRDMATVSGSEYPWRMQAASRLIVKHESEWAKPSKWAPLFAALEAKTGPSIKRDEEKKRLEKLVWWEHVSSKIHGFPASAVFHVNPIAFAANFFGVLDTCVCGCCYGTNFKVTKMVSNYGPVHWGVKSMKQSTALNEMLTAGEISESERRILVAMSNNEGKLDSVQSYDSEVLTAGAMQKTINSMGRGEFSTQVAKFRASDEVGYRDLFEQCGWYVEGSGKSSTMYYAHPKLTDGKKNTGNELKEIIRKDCSESNFGKQIKNPPLAAIVHAISSTSYEKLQLMDFIDRLRIDVLPTIPRGYTHTIREYFLSDLGRATALDQSVNRPAYVGRDIGKALDSFFNNHPSISKDPNEWGENHFLFESEVLEIYGPTRQMAKIGGINVASERYAAIKNTII